MEVLGVILEYQNLPLHSWVVMDTIMIKYNRGSSTMLEYDPLCAYLEWNIHSMGIMSIHTLVIVVMRYWLRWNWRAGKSKKMEIGREPKSRGRLYRFWEYVSDLLTIYGGRGSLNRKIESIPHHKHSVQYFCNYGVPVQNPQSVPIPYPQRVPIHMRFACRSLPAFCAYPTINYTIKVYPFLRLIYNDWQRRRKTN